MILFIKYALFYGSFLVFPFLIALWYIGKTQWGRRSRPALWGVFVVCLFIIWIRFVEPNMLIIRETTIEAGFFDAEKKALMQQRTTLGSAATSTDETASTTKETGLLSILRSDRNEVTIALIADIHLGLYKGVKHMEKVVEKIQSLEPDYVLIAGDFTYEPNIEKLPKLFHSLRRIDAPIYAVYGNHDVERPGPPLRDELQHALNLAGVEVMHNGFAILDGFVLAGLGPWWRDEDDVTVLDQFTPEENVIVLTHNPDTTTKYTNNHADITFTGYTHCGQIRFPLLYKMVLPTIGDFDKGLTQEEHTQLYITCGTGEIGLPARFLNPPVIDLITIK